MTDPKIRVGGLMRCGTQSIWDHHAENGPQKEGTIIRCKHCQGPIIFVNGAWEWHRKEANTE